MPTYLELKDFQNTSYGLTRLFAYAAYTVPLFTPMVLGTLFLIILLGSYFSQRRLSGKGDFFAAFAVAGYVTVIVAGAMTLVDGLINLSALVVCFIVAIIGTFLLFISKKSEV